MELKGQSIAVTGGASGLGLATAQRILDAGGLVTLIDLPTSDGASTAADLGPRPSSPPPTSPMPTSSAPHSTSPPIVAGSADWCIAQAPDAACGFWTRKGKPDRRRTSNS